jgi:hypothetical protein
LSKGEINLHEITRLSIGGKRGIIRIFILDGQGGNSAYGWFRVAPVGQEPKQQGHSPKRHGELQEFLAALDCIVLLSLY